MIAAAAFVSACGGGEPVHVRSAAHLASDPCSARAQGVNANLPQRCLRGGEQERVERPVASPSAAVAGATCAQPARVIAYAQDDWIGLAEDFAAAPAGCIEAWISVPTEEGADKAWLTTRTGMRERFARIGANVHPMPEVNFNDWNAWGKDHPDVSWLERGRRARAEMERAGYDFGRGDRWALNEVPIAALESEPDRAAVRDLVRGLQGSSPQPTGVVYVVMQEQSSGLTPALEAELRGWFADTAFWAEMRKAVDAWSVEAYASVRDTCQPGLGASAQVAGVRAYADHRIAVAERMSLPDGAAVRAVLERSVPLVNGAWAWQDAYGFTAVPPAVMRRFVEVQVAAMARRLTGDDRPTVGFAWAPRRPDGMADAAYRRELGLVAAAIRDAVVNEVRTDGRVAPAPCRYPDASLADWG